MEIILCWWCWAGLCCWIEILLNQSCPCHQPYFGSNTTGKHSNTTDKFEISRLDGDGDGWWTTSHQWWCWCCWIEIQLNPSCRCQQPSLPRIRLQRLTEFTNIWYFFWNTHLYFHTQSCYTRIQHNEIHNLKCASVLKSNCVRNCRKCTITPADEFWKYTITPTNSEINLSSRDPTYIKNRLFSDCLFKVHL